MSWVGLGRHFPHELIVVFLIDSLVVDHAHLANLVLARLLVLHANLQMAERLSLVSDLVYYAVQSCQVGGRFHISKNFLLRHLRVDLRKLVHLEQLLNQTGVCLLSHEQDHHLGIVTQVNLAALQAASLQCFLL